jgi:hypothetical protein
MIFAISLSHIRLRKIILLSDCAFFAHNLGVGLRLGRTSCQPETEEIDVIIDAAFSVETKHLPLVI